MEKTTNYGLNKPAKNEFYNIEEINENMDIIDEQLKSVEENAKKTEDIKTHIEDMDNPHEVTKTQVGLGNVPNVSTNNQTPTYNVTSELTELTSGEKLSTALGKLAKAILELISHISNKSNPHSVTKSQIGLGNVENTKDADKPISTATQAALDLKATANTVSSHTSNKSNPHGVTKTQIGLGNVNNTSDENKPISTATQEALDLKAEASAVSSHTSNKSNPHSVTKTQVGLGNVPNVATNDQTPTYSVASELSELISGEKISTAFGKLKLTVKNVITILELLGTTTLPYPTSSITYNISKLNTDKADVSAVGKQSALPIASGTFAYNISKNATDIKTNANDIDTLEAYLLTSTNTGLSASTNGYWETLNSDGEPSTWAGYYKLGIFVVGQFRVKCIKSNPNGNVILNLPACGNYARIDGMNETTGLPLLFGIETNGVHITFNRDGNKNSISAGDVVSGSFVYRRKAL